MTLIFMDIVDKSKHRYISTEVEPDGTEPHIILRKQELVKQMFAHGFIKSDNRFYKSPESMNWKQEDEFRQAFGRHLYYQGLPWLHIVKYE